MIEEPTLKKAFHDDSICCPYCGCIIHLAAAEVGTLPDSTSGKSLVLRYDCEEGHAFEIRTIDHSGGTWPSIHRIPPRILNP